MMVIVLELSSATSEDQGTRLLLAATEAPREVETIAMTQMMVVGRICLHLEPWVG